MKRRQHNFISGFLNNSTLVLNKGCFSIVIHRTPVNHKILMHKKLSCQHSRELPLYLDWLDRSVMIAWLHWVRNLGYRLLVSQKMSYLKMTFSWVRLSNCLITWVVWFYCHLSLLLLFFMNLRKLNDLYEKEGIVHYIEWFHLYSGWLGTKWEVVRTFPSHQTVVFSRSVRVKVGYFCAPMELT